MKKFLKILLWTIVPLIVLVAALLAVFAYKIENGFPVFYETDAPVIDFPADQKTVLLFSKATGFRHGESIEAGQKAFIEMAKKNNWFLYNTEEGGVFNPEQLAKFDVVIFNNSTGRVLNDEQQKALEEYVAQGGVLIGIHGSGDSSHHWDWYEKNLMGSKFSHHPLDPQLQETEVTLNNVPDSLIARGLPTTWKHTDEWYVFTGNPRAKGFHILYAIDGESINPNGNILWIKDRNFGMGKDHPVAWYRETGKGLTFYTSIGHNAEAWKQEAFVTMLENVINK
ncbi:MAG TPA: ThuA domain-containing protein [Chryseolinea sp.]|nr:ThuA domain-containing protein [Chryseolinea sp.]